MPSVFFSYSHADEDLRDQLEKQLSMLKRQGAIDTWHDLADPACTCRFAPGHEPRLANFGLSHRGFCATAADAAGRGASE